MAKEYVVSSVSFRSLFDALGEDEQVFIVQLTRLLNEINILQKGVLYTTNCSERLEVPQQTARRVQVMFLLRELASKLWEGWQILQKSYFGAALSKRYTDGLSQDAAAALKCIKDYFQRPGNPLKKIRDKHGSHYDASVIRDQLGRIPPDDRMPVFLAEDRGNCVFVFAEDLAAVSVQESFGQKSEASMNRLVGEVAVEVPGWFQVFATHILLTLIRREEPLRSEYTIEELPTLSQVQFPFFVRPDPD